MELQSIQQQNVQNQDAGPRRSRCISLCRRFTYLDPVNGMPPATCKERSRGGFRGLCLGLFSGAITALSVWEITDAIKSRGGSVSEEVATKIRLSIFGTISVLGTTFGIAHPSRRQETLGYQVVNNNP